MIQAIRLQNFQQHASLEVRFEPGLNVITGRTDAGKSTIIRALKWATLHTPGTKIIRHGAKVMRVGIKTSKGKLIRFREPSRNGYEVQGTEYVAVKQEQPAEVLEVLNLTDLNFQFQHDPKFLLTLTPGQVAKEVNRIVDLAAIDECQTWLKSQAARSKTLLEGCVEKLDASKIAVEALSWVPEASESWNSLVLAKQTLEALKTKCSQIAALASEIEAIGDQGVSLGKLRHALTLHLEEVAKIRSGQAALRDRITELGSIVEGFRGTEAIGELESYAADLGALLQVPRGVSPKALEALVSGLQEISSEISELAKIDEALVPIIQMQESSAQQKAKGLKLKALVTELQELESAVSHEELALAQVEEKLGELCPTCGKPKNR